MSAGYFAGGYSGNSLFTTDKLIFLTDTSTLKSSANLVSQARRWLGSCNSSIIGYFAGGEVSGPGVTAVADRLIFSTDTTAALSSANLSQGRSGPGGCESATNGYFAGGATGNITGFQVTADKLVFATETTAAKSSANLSLARWEMGTCNSSTNGYFAGGWSGSGDLVTTDKLVFSTDTTAAQSSANLSQGRYGPGGCNSIFNGYFAGGFTTSAIVGTADKLVFSTDTTAAQSSANLGTATTYIAGCSSYNAGYFAGGTTSATDTTVAWKLWFSTDTTLYQSTATLGQARHGLAGVEIPQIKRKVIHYFSSGTIISGNIINAGVISGSIASGQIGRMHLSSGAINSGHLGNEAIINFSKTNADEFIYQTKESISGFMPVCLVSGWKILTAMGASGLRMPAFGITTINVVSGALANIVTNGYLMTSGMDLLWSGQCGKSLYVSTSGFLMTPTKPDTGLTQRMGISISGGLIVLPTAMASGNMAVNASGAL